MRCSNVGMPTSRSDRPVPRLSNRMTRLNEASRVKNRLSNRSSQVRSRWESSPGT